MKQECFRNMRGNIVSRFASVLVMTAGGLCAQPVPSGADDPGGWTKAKWGMTEEKGLFAVGLLDQKTRVQTDGTEESLVECGNLYSCTSAIPQSTSASRSARRKAAEDLAVATLGEAYIKAELNEQASRLAKDSLLTALSEKYGNPSTHTTKTAGIEEFIWQFPTTVITLMWTHSEFKQLDSVRLFYALRRKSSDL
jgi:hypothetical protein